MQRDMNGPPRLALLSGLLLLVACGAPDAVPASTAEPLGTHEAASCSNSAVTALTIAEVSLYGGELAGNGDWTVSYPANAVRLEYYVDGQLKSFDERCNMVNGVCTSSSTTTSGTWYFSQTGITCGSHTFEVRAYPMIIDSAGGRSTCMSNPGKTASQSVTQTCLTASLSCSRTNSTTITCNGSASGGAGGPYTPFWQERYVYYYDGEQYISGWFQGSWTESFYCAQTNVRDPANHLTVQFKVRDSSGKDSTVRSAIYFCEP